MDFIFSELPKQGLFWEVFWWDFYGGSSVDNIGAFPLGSCDVNGANGALWGHVDFDSAQVSLLSRSCDAGADVYAKLHHVIAVF